MFFILLEVSRTKRCFQCWDTEAKTLVSAKVITRHSSAESEKKGGKRTMQQKERCWKIISFWAFSLQISSSCSCCLLLWFKTYSRATLCVHHYLCVCNVCGAGGVTPGSRMSKQHRADPTNRLRTAEHSLLLPLGELSCAPPLIWHL